VGADWQTAASLAVTSALGTSRASKRSSARSLYTPCLSLWQAGRPLLGCTGPFLQHSPSSAHWPRPKPPCGTPAIPAEDASANGPPPSRITRIAKPAVALHRPSPSNGQNLSRRPRRPKFWRSRPPGFLQLQI